MAFFQNAAKVMIKAIGKVWSFATTMALITALATFVFFTLAIAMPNNVAKAIEIVKCCVTEVEIVGTG